MGRIPRIYQVLHDSRLTLRWYFSSFPEAAPENMNDGTRALTAHARCVKGDCSIRSDCVWVSINQLATCVDRWDLLCAPSPINDDIYWMPHSSSSHPVRGALRCFLHNNRTLSVDDWGRGTEDALRRKKPVSFDLYASAPWRFVESCQTHNDRANCSSASRHTEEFSKQQQPPPTSAPLQLDERTLLTRFEAKFIE